MCAFEDCYSAEHTKHWHSAYVTVWAVRTAARTQIFIHLLNKLLPKPKLVTEFKNALWSTLPEKAIDSAMKDYRLYISGTIEAATNVKVGTQIRL